MARDPNSPAKVTALQYAEWTDKRGEKLEGYGHAIVFMQTHEVIDVPVTPTNPAGKGKVLRCYATVPAWVAEKLYDRPGSEAAYRVEYLEGGVAPPPADAAPVPGEMSAAALRERAKELGKAFPASTSKAELLAYIQEQEAVEGA